MKYKEFEHIISDKRMSKYVQACGGNTRRAMTLYRYNVELSQMMFAIIAYFEVALRNSIDRQLITNLGSEWLRDSVMANGVFTHPVLFKTRDIIYHAYNKLLRDGAYSTQGIAIYTNYILTEYKKILVLLEWMDINARDFLYGIDHVQQVCIKIDKLKPI